jgi:hypothetical protein
MLKGLYITCRVCCILEEKFVRILRFGRLTFQCFVKTANHASIRYTRQLQRQPKLKLEHSNLKLHYKIKITNLKLQN